MCECNLDGRQVVCCDKLDFVSDGLRLLLWLRLDEDVPAGRAAFGETGVKRYTDKFKVSVQVKEI